MLLRLLFITIVVLIGAAILGAFDTHDNTNPLLKGLSVIRSLFHTGGTLQSQSAVTAVYKWQDATGEWHFSNQPPPEDVASKITIYRGNDNIIPATPLITTTDTQATAEKNPAPAIPLLPITNPGRVKKLIDDAKNIQQLSEDRARARE